MISIYNRLVSMQITLKPHDPCFRPYGIMFGAIWDHRSVGRPPNTNFVDTGAVFGCNCFTSAHYKTVWKICGRGQSRWGNFSSAIFARGVIFQINKLQLRNYLYLSDVQIRFNWSLRYFSAKIKPAALTDPGPD